MEAFALLSYQTKQTRFGRYDNNDMAVSTTPWDKAIKKAFTFHNLNSQKIVVFHLCTTFDTSGLKLIYSKWSKWVAFEHAQSKQHYQHQKKKKKGLLLWHLLSKKGKKRKWHGTPHPPPPSLAQLIWDTATLRSHFPFSNGKSSSH